MPRQNFGLVKLQRELQAVKLLIVDELGYAPLSPTGVELLFEVFFQRYERDSNLPLEDWASVMGSPAPHAVPLVDGQISCDDFRPAAWPLRSLQA